MSNNVGVAQDIIKASQGKPITYMTEFARHDLVHCSVPGLFRSQFRTNQRRGFDIVFQQGEFEYRFLGNKVLGGSELLMLQTLVALAGVQGDILDSEPESDVGKVLRTGLEAEHEARNMQAIVVRTTFYQLLKEAGLDHRNMGGATIEWLREVLLNLSMVTIVVSKDGGKKFAIFKILSFAACDGDEKTLAVGLNPYIAKAILGGKHVYIDMNEVRRIKKEQTRILHQRLCSWIDPGKKGTISLDKMASYVYGDADGVNKTARSRRRSVIKKCLEELNQIGWSIIEKKPKIFEILRPGKQSKTKSDLIELI